LRQLNRSCAAPPNMWRRDMKPELRNQNENQCRMIECSSEVTV
jgi:hypothetical protein